MISSLLSGVRLREDKGMMNLRELLEGIEVLTLSGKVDYDVTGISCDSRRVKPGHVFVAINGTKVSGLSFAEDALRRGAVAIVVEASGNKAVKTSDFRERCGAVVTVADARTTLAMLSCAFFGDPADRLHITGITGTNGKTTTAYLVRNIMESQGRCAGLLSTVEYIIGARTIPAVRTTSEAPELQKMFSQMLDAGCQCAVMEVSSHAIMQARTAGIDFDTAVFTNLSRDHLDYHQTMENYFNAKAQLFIGLGKGTKKGTAVINVDDSWGRRLFEMKDIVTDKLTYGLDGNADVRALSLKLSSGGTSYDVETPWGTGKVNTHLLGRFNVSNALAAITACGAAGIDLEAMTRVISSTSGVAGRLEEIKSRKNFQVFVDYAHTDDALEKVLVTLREITENRLIVVFGCGGNRDRTKRPAMGRIAGQLADYTILTSDNPRCEDPEEIISEIRQGLNGNTNYEMISDRRSAIRRGLELASKGDIVLLAGKGHENFQEQNNSTIPFDDRSVVRQEMELL